MVILLFPHWQDVNFEAVWCNTGKQGIQSFYFTIDKFSFFIIIMGTTLSLRTSRGEFQMAQEHNEQ